MRVPVAGRNMGRLRNRRQAPVQLCLAASTLALLALTGCTTLGNPPSSAGEDALYANSQSNLVSLTEVVDKHPDDPQAYNMRGSVLGGAGRQEQALADFSKAISLDPNYAQAYANRALVYRKVNKLDLALADDNKALTLDAS